MATIIFQEEMIDTFTLQEREMFDALVAKGKAQIQSDKFDVKAYLAKRDAIEQAERQARQELEAGFL